jgi:hypothetical protein
MRENMHPFCFWSWLTSLSMMSSSCIHSFKPHVIIPCGWVVLHCVCICIHIYHNFMIHSSL